MKFITDKNVTLTDKKLKIEVVMLPPTNKQRFTIYEMGTDESLPSRIELAEYIYGHCLDRMIVAGKSVDPQAMLTADLGDQDTANVYFGVVNLVVTELMEGISEDEAKK